MDCGTFVAAAVYYYTGQLYNVADVEDAEHSVVFGGGGVGSLEADTASVVETCQTDESRQQNGLDHTLVACRHTDSGFFLSDNAQSYHYVGRDREECEHSEYFARKTGPTGPLG